MFLKEKSNPDRTVLWKGEYIYGTSFTYLVSMELVLPGKNRVEKKNQLKYTTRFIYDSQTDNDLYMCGNVTTIIKTIHVYV